VTSTRRATRAGLALSALNVRLHALSIADLPQLCKLFDGHSRTDGTIDTPLHLRPAATQIWLETQLSDPADSSLLWAVCPVHSERLIGFFALHDIDYDHGQAEVRFRADSKSCREGDAIGAGQAVLAYAFGSLDLTSVCAFSPSGSTHSSGTLANMGLHALPPSASFAGQWKRCAGVQAWSLDKRQWTRQVEV
jgi:RimJ/RimL family protein N-acetyltransferase